MMPLQLHVKAVGTTEGIRANVQAALARNLPELSTAMALLHGHSGPMVIVGSGPSMPTHLEEIRGERAKGHPIFAVKGAHDFLCQQGLQPDYWLCVDPRDRTYLLKDANDHTTYFVSSRCDASIFEALKDRKVILVHTWAHEEHCDEYKDRLLIGGGTTSGLRAITLSYVLGFRKIVLYGFDSCLAKDRFTKRFTGEGTEPDKVIDVIVGGKRFWCNGAMAQQANEFQHCHQTMPGIQIEAKGDGLIAAILKDRKRRDDIVFS